MHVCVCVCVFRIFAYLYLNFGLLHLKTLFELHREAFESRNHSLCLLVPTFNLLRGFLLSLARSLTHGFTRLTRYAGEKTAELFTGIDYI